ncbi:arsenate reductase (glutaredoxin) [Glaciecola sp. XM2]|jgi:arsenate reductase|uniref:arsenate reductase (glutaredoxin) n=1 Tax=Glaciecola sp. XM2 TaxID=1914931 RepID=UPI001BDDCE26|nr:arsenate reductase (glutaredoxin) [Glaciecola sp. XM2]MBT1449587.1 arsenate reductase (glutaredoxin) [Glaciecola sp. XM2]
MPKATLYHNPRCSKSRQALDYVKQQAVDLEVVEYLKAPLTKPQLAALFETLDIASAHDMIRPKEAEYKEAGLSKTASDDEVLNAIAEYPKLLERPILYIENRAAIGRPLDNIAALFHG